MLYILELKKSFKKNLLHIFVEIFSPVCVGEIKNVSQFILKSNTYTNISSGLSLSSSQNNLKGKT